MSVCVTIKTLHDFCTQHIINGDWFAFLTLTCKHGYQVHRPQYCALQTRKNNRTHNCVISNSDVLAANS